MHVHLNDLISSKHNQVLQVIDCQLIVMVSSSGDRWCTQKANVKLLKGVVRR